MTEALYIKDPEAVLDYAFDWTEWIDSTSSPAETISSHTVTVPSGITKDSDGESNGIVTIWLSGGTEGHNYKVECKVVTSESRTEERSITILCQER